MDVEILFSFQFVAVFVLCWTVKSRNAELWNRKVERFRYTKNV